MLHLFLNSETLVITILFLIGLTGFISGEFIISSTLFAAAAIASNISVKHKRIKTGQLSWD
jgi:CheY-specific phosphatase CheX